MTAEYEPAAAQRAARASGTPRARPHGSGFILHSDGRQVTDGSERLATSARQVQGGQAEAGNRPVRSGRSALLEASPASRDAPGQTPLGLSCHSEESSTRNLSFPCYLYIHARIAGAAPFRCDRARDRSELNLGVPEKTYEPPDLHSNRHAY